MCIINKHPPPATKSTYMKPKLSKYNVSRHENEKPPQNSVLLTKSPHSHAFDREHSTGILRRLQSHQQPMYAGVSVSIGGFMDVSPLRQFAPWMFRPQDVLPSGWFAPTLWTFRPLDFKTGLKLNAFCAFLAINTYLCEVLSKLS